MYLEAVSTVVPVVEVLGDSNDLVTVDTEYATVAEADVEPGGLCG